MQEAISICEELTGKPMKISYKEETHIGDHVWRICDVRKFQSHYPEWKCRYNIHEILTEIDQALNE